MRAALDELQATLIAAIVDLRRAIFALRPVDLDALGFFPAPAQLVSDFADQNHLIARLEVAGPQDALPAVYELSLFRIIQEGLNNIGRNPPREHRQLQRVHRGLTLQPDQARSRIRGTLKTWW